MTHSWMPLQQRLNYFFLKPEHLTTALTHSSVGKNNNERLEFLGDALLSCIISKYLFKQFPEIQEGQLSRMRAALVKGETLTQLAQAFHLADFILLGPGEKKSKHQCRDSILAGAMEALIGAIYLDSHFDTCERCVLAWYKNFLPDIQAEQRYVDAKTQLQELLQAKKYALPLYTIRQQMGNGSQQIFTVECRVAALDLVTLGQGKNRRQAEQQAAATMLEKIHHA